MELEEYVQHLVAGEDDVCLAEAKRIATDIPGLHRLYINTIAASQRRVGELWETGKISVATEHLATAVNRYVAACCYAPLARHAAGGPRAVIACTPGDLHEIGPRLLADLLECDGWNTDFYGSSMPLRDLVDAVMERPPVFVGISAALVMHLGSVRKTIAALRDGAGSDCPPMAVGGNAFQSDPDLWRQVGADMYAPDASQAVHLLASLKPRRAD